MVDRSELTERFVSELTSNQPRLFAYVMSLLRNPDEARDVLQETNLVLWKKLEEYAEIVSFEAWSTKVAYFQVLAFRRDRGRDRHQFDDQLITTIATAAEQATQNTNQRLRFLNKCIEKLSESHRDLLNNRYSKQKSVKELAETMGKTPAALGMTLYRVRRLLLDCVEAKLLAEGSHE